MIPVVIAIILLFTFVSIGDKFHLKVLLAAALLINEMLSFFYMWVSGIWHYSFALPLHLCDIAVFILIISCFKYYPLLFALTYYWGIGGSLQAIATPNIPADIPLPVYISFYFAHIGTFVGAMYLAFGLNFALPKYSILKVWLISHLYALVIFIFNSQYGTNYLFINQKPSEPSVLDYFGPWPDYLLGMEALFIFSLFILWAIYKTYHHFQAEH